MDTFDHRLTELDSADSRTEAQDDLPTTRLRLPGRYGHQIARLARQS